MIGSGGEGIRVSHVPEVEPLMPPGDPEDADDGDWVVARPLMAEARPHPELDAPPTGGPRELTGILTRTWNDLLGRWNWTVNGRAVDPASVRTTRRPDDRLPEEEA